MTLFQPGDLLRFKEHQVNYRFVNMNCTSTYLDTKNINTILFLGKFTDRETTTLVLRDDGSYLQGFIFTHLLEKIDDS